MKKFLLAMGVLLTFSALQAQVVPMTFRNGGTKSIPLLIPGVMNPNLSPMGNSGVDLKVGQKVLFRYKGKKQTLLVVDEDMRDKTLRIDKILKARKEEIDAEMAAKRNKSKDE